MPDICGITYHATKYSFRPESSSELLIKCLDVRPGDRFLDMGSGTGVVGIFAAKQGARVVAVDISPIAIEQTRNNSRRNRVSLRTVRSNLFARLDGRFDTIAFNAPFTRLTCDGTEDMRMVDHTGISRMETVRRFLRELPGHLTKKGVGYLVLSPKGPCDEFERAAVGSRLRWKVLARQDSAKNPAFVIRLTRA